MRKSYLILSLAALTVLAGASDAFAQRRGYGGGRGYSPGVSISVGGFGYSSGYYGNRGYSPNYYGNRYGYAPSYYYATPGYYSEPAIVVPAVQIRQSYYPAPASVQQSVTVTVLVPPAAQVWFENRATAQQGTERVFQSPPLEANHTFTYTIKASWVQNGQAVTRERRVNVQAGQNVTVDFRPAAGEIIAPPLPNAIPRD